ncbi:family 16 glycoside hydrolase [Niabella digestorum]|uniref:Family 16 glycoside hydrolase n=1 Tax=Niabella digestorum TaxID=3117701 RepID=A0ABU7REI7_9BACT
MKKIKTGAAIVLSAIAVYSCAPRTNTGTPTTAEQPAPVAQAPTTAPEPKEETPAPKPAPEVVHNTLTPEEKAAGWQLLFDGVSTDGWHAYGSKTIGTAWKVANGTLYLDATKDGTPKTGGDIVTDKEYKNFELKLDWKIDKNGNSGICIYVHENKDRFKYMWYTGPEIQIVDNEGHPDGRVYKHQAGDLYDLIPAKTKAANPPLEWNQYLIRCVNGKLDIYLNDQHVVSTTLWDENWRNLVANSKFKGIPEFGTYKVGRIGLQDHGNNVWFRNIKIREL